MRVRNGGRARCPHRAANPHEMPTHHGTMRDGTRAVRTRQGTRHGAGWQRDTSGAHGNGTMRRDRDIAPYRQAARAVRAATGRCGASREARRPSIAPYRQAARAVRTHHGARNGTRAVRTHHGAGWQRDEGERIDG